MIYSKSILHRHLTFFLMDLSDVLNISMLCNGFFRYLSSVYPGSLFQPWPLIKTPYRMELFFNAIWWVWPLSQTEESEGALSFSNSVLRYPAPYWTSLNPFLSSAVPSNLHSTLWAMLHPTELHLHFTTHPSEHCILLNYELRGTMRAIHYSLTELPSVLVPLCNFVKCRNAGLSSTRMLRSGLSCWMPEYRCRRHRPRCRYLAILTSGKINSDTTKMPTRGYTEPFRI